MVKTTTGNARKACPIWTEGDIPDIVGMTSKAQHSLTAGRIQDVNPGGIAGVTDSCAIWTPDGIPYSLPRASKRDQLLACIGIPNDGSSIGIGCDQSPPIWAVSDGRWPEVKISGRRIAHHCQ